MYDAVDNLVLNGKTYADAFPMLVAKIYWQEQVSVRFVHSERGMYHVPFPRSLPGEGSIGYIDCSKKRECPSLSNGSHTLVAWLLYLSSCGITVKDCGGLNLAVSGNTALEALPRLLFIDCLSWTEDATVSCNWSGYFGLVRTYVPSRRSWLVAALAGRSQNNASTRLPRSAQHTLSA